MSRRNKRLKPLCVGCHKRSTTCRETNIGEVCRKCRPLLAQVVRWSHEAHHGIKPTEQQPHAVQRMVTGFR